MLGEGGEERKAVTLSLTWKNTGNLGKKAFHRPDWDAVFLILHARYYLLHLENTRRGGGVTGEKEPKWALFFFFLTPTCLSKRGSCMSQTERSKQTQTGSCEVEPCLRGERRCEERQLVTNKHWCQASASHSTSLPDSPLKPAFEPALSNSGRGAAVKIPVMIYIRANDKYKAPKKRCGGQKMCLYSGAKWVMN